MSDSVQLDGQMNGEAGYKASWGIVQTSVHKLKKETIVPVPASTRAKRTKYQFPKRRVAINLHRDLMVYQVFKNAQKFQLEHESTIKGRPNRVDINLDPIQKPERARKDKRYDFNPVMENLPKWTYLIRAAYEDKVADVEQGECDLSKPLMFGTECKEGSVFLPAPLSSDIDDQLAELYISSKVHDDSPRDGSVVSRILDQIRRIF